MSVLAICDELAAIIEPDPTLRNDARARPREYGEDTLYVWPLREWFTPEDTGGNDLDQFAIAVAWAEERMAEGDEPSREVSDAIAGRADAVGVALRAHRGGATYENAQLVSIDYEALYGFDVRGFIATVQGWIQRTD